MHSPNVVLQAVPANEVRYVWETVRNGLQAAARFSKGEWMAEDAYASLTRGEMSLYLWICDKRYAGSIILMKRAGFTGPALHVFSLYVPSEYGEHIDNNMHQLDDLARQHGCHRITFQSPRKGWEKRGAKLGFEPKTVIFEKEV